ncbi:hypothetical protein B484DRAFT_391069 [Ochromonadaceae sp. CCMP2298]|nr:hypothetical protein B484DRAFT_391069 [Ochromonadaceae sp. CCMP2298]
MPNRGGGGEGGGSGGGGDEGRGGGSGGGGSGGGDGGSWGAAEGGAPGLPCSFADLDETLSHLSSRELGVLQLRRRLLEDWGFHFSLHSTSLRLLRAPLVLSEPLHGGDFREFLTLIADNSELPDNLLRPSAAARIVARYLPPLTLTPLIFP